MPFTEQDLYGDPEPTWFRRVAGDKLDRLEAASRALDALYRAARGGRFIGEHDGLSEFIVAIERASKERQP